MKKEANTSVNSDMKTNIKTIAISVAVALSVSSAVAMYSSMNNKVDDVQPEPDVTMQDILSIQHEISQIKDLVMNSEFTNMTDESFEEKVETAINAIVDRRQRSQVAAQPIQQNVPAPADRIASSDHSLDASINEDGEVVYGNPDADFSIYTFEDYRCGFCREYHDIMKDYITSTDGEVNWIYKPYPVLGDASYQLAMAGQCVAAIEGPQAMLAYSEHAYSTQNWLTAIQRSNLQNLDAVESCVRNADRSFELADVKAIGEDLGITGTPASIFRNNVTENGALVGGRLLENQIDQMIQQVSE